MTRDTGSGTPAYITGVPHPLPAGEQLLWEGAPAAPAVARHVYHWRWFAAYFAVMLLAWGSTAGATITAGTFWPSLAVRLLLTGVVLAIVWGLAILTARTSWYAITNRRVVLRIGMVFPMSINIPFTILQSADLGAFPDGTGQLVLTLVPGQRIAYIALWPHCQVWRINQPRPMLRGLTEPARIGALLAAAVQAAGGHPVAADAGTPRAVARLENVEGGSMPHPAGA
ncbi:MAG: photosynthetic complex putative assembly protein PuhB [Gemmatimonadaceae bacterium]